MSVIDVTNLRSMTQGNRELEVALFAEFDHAAHAALATLAAHCLDGSQEPWRATAHALKGTSYNLGALTLGDLCKQAQEQAAHSAADKQALLFLIEAEYVRVKAYLETVHV